MGLSIFKKSCFTNSEVVAPNPNPLSYIILSTETFNNATLLKVKYIGCTNFEGIKLLVYKGFFKPIGELDPHFSEGISPIARFKPTEEGYQLAVNFCKSL